MSERLLDVKRSVSRWRGSRELVPLDKAVCLQCGGPVTFCHVGQPALFRSHGYGATRRTTVLVCDDCTFARVVEIQEVRPERVSA